MAADPFGKLFVQIGVDLAAFQRDLKKVSKDFSSFGKELIKIGKELTIGLTAPIAGFAAAAFASSDQATRSFKNFGEEIKSSMGKIGTDLFHALNVQGILDTLSDALAGVANAFRALPSVVQTTIAVIGTFVAIIGPALIVIGQLSLLIGKAAAAFSLFTKAASLIGLGPIGILVTVITALGAVIAGLAFRDTAGDLQFFGTAAEISAQKIEAAQKRLSELGRIDLAKARAEFDALTEKVRNNEETLRKNRDILSEVIKKEGENSLSAIGLKASIQGLEGAQRVYNRRLDELKGVLTGATEAQEKEKIAVEKIKIAMDEATDSMRGVKSEFALTGDKGKKLEGDLKAIAAVLAVLKKEAPESEAFAAFLGEQGNLEDRLRLLKEANEEIAEADEKAIEAKRHFEEINDPILQITESLQAMGTTAQQVGQAVASLVETVTSGIGNAVARAIVEGQSLAKSLKSLLKEVSTAVISFLVQIAVRAVLTAAISAAVFAVSGAIQEFGPIVGLLIGGALAAAAVALVYAVAASAGAQEGGLFTHPGTTRIAEKGEPEIVLNQGNVRRFFGGAGVNVAGDRPQTIHVHLETSGREFAHAVLPYIPGVLRLHGAAG